MLTPEATSILSRDTDIGQTQRLYVTVQVNAFNADTEAPHTATLCFQVGSQTGAPVTLHMNPRQETARIIYQSFYGLPLGPLTVHVFASADTSDHVSVVDVSLGCHG